MRAAREHLATCDKHPEAAELQQAASSLATAAPEMDPPPALKSRLMEAVRAEAPAAAPQQRESAGGGLLDWFRGNRLGYAMAAVLALIVVGLGAWNLSLQGDETSGEQVVQLSGITDARVIYIEDEGLAIMEIDELDVLPEAQVYQTWAITDDGPVSLGTFRAAKEGETRVAMAADLTGVTSIAVTIEPAPGVEQPTTAPILSGDV
jgi:anti-sigma-K factor RskA